MKNGRYITPSLRKVLLVLTILVLLILSAGIFFLLYSVYDTQKAATERLDTAIQEQLSEANRRLLTANFYLTEVLMGNVQASTIGAAQRVHDRNVAARGLSEEFAYQGNYWAEDFSFFFFERSSETSVWHYSSDVPYRECDEIQSRLKARFLTGENRGHSLSWNCILVEERPYLVQYYSDKSNFAAAWIACDSLFSALLDVVLTEQGFYVLVDEENVPVLGDTQLWELGISLGENEAAAEKSGFCGIYDMNRANLRLAIADTPYADRGNLLLLAGFLCSVLLILLLFSGYTFHYFHHYIEIPFRQVRDRIDEYTALRKNTKRHGFSELNGALEAFDSLERQLNALKIDFYEEKLTLARTELEYYQLQIKPHFFLNCFSIIFSMSQSEDYERIQMFCMKLSNYVRYLFTDGFSVVPLETECAMVREYVEIQNIRRRTENKVKEDIPEDLLSLEIPPLLLMTFVENSLKHAGVRQQGICVSLKAGKAVLEGEPALELFVLDNGPGFSEQNLEELNAGDEPKLSGGRKHVGLHNIYKRLSLLYGSHFRLEFYNTEAGAGVYTVIPVRQTPVKSKNDFRPGERKAAPTGLGKDGIDESFAGG